MNLGFDYSVIGNRIRKAREEKGITQETLAESLDVSNAYLSKIERGRTPVNLNKLDKICAIMEKSADYIFRGANTSNEDYNRN